MQIYYFTRTGTCEGVAQTLSKRHSTVPRKIEDHKNWQGPLGYLKAGWAALRGKRVQVTYQKPGEEEKIVVVSPLWAGKLPPAVSTFVSEVGREKLILIICSMGSTLTDRMGYARVIDRVGNDRCVPEEL